ncbi:MAG: hypothetical protein A3C27_02775 [Candidatus Levybacteria bacterium RIFCSPHIGHO2_02_FULL_39_36]|nr:MAG: UDP-N-acetylmuramyl-tripeptide synthetase [Candidatus Levybacteria bacterium GW2011_GWA1_39_11]KKR49538.1 MAG: UDP-N-acetylmuramyl-tripeptide synthetase [Candidatus Levybacteria bacterium GW2011_GWA2_40_16]OGH15157.1 MAG: hypothetical protein A2689_01520 [Candidatus Levybacteria bacterium RIFCSPHIGHO2_01_FULL_38_96]OGH26044.1 MAG: hypothetical protein A3E68_01940 [Candidatus Levybacteria bacterium RIFCSPHIGHO2_12_FULL_39_39]OGH27548.1 MAG: hypothetical protein A3C27_02775 [Candidatus Le
MLRKIKNFIHAWKADMAHLFYGRSARKLFVIGVTGTDGKTTTASLIYHILNSSGEKVSMITTLGAKIGESTYDTGFHTTTPSSFTLQKFIKKAADYRSRYLVLELTSHALDQDRAKGVNFKIGVLTNITHEHLDYHKTYGRYVQAKTKLLKLSETSIINLDDESYNLVSKELKGRKVLTYSIDKKTADFNTHNVKINLPEPYDFNTQNFLAAIAAAKTMGIDDRSIQRAISTFVLPEGRLDVVYDNEFKAIVDFAHTPNSINKVLPVIKKDTKGRLIHVFGSAGERDRSKRSLMGEASSRSADIIILAAEDPRSEKIENINSQIRQGIRSGFSFAESDLYQDLDGKKICFEIPDRQKAIGFAVNIAKKGDAIVVTGKGHEKSMNLGHGEIPWSDHEAIAAAIKKKNS